jgi:hypothetical protein
VLEPRRLSFSTVGEIRNIYKFLGGKHEMKTLLEQHRRTWMKLLKNNLDEIGFQNANFIQPLLSHGRFMVGIL